MNLKARLTWVEHRRQSPPLPPTPPGVLAGKLVAELVALSELPGVDPAISRRLARGASRLAAEGMPTRLTLRAIRDALDVLIAQLDDDCDESRSY
jgi:hypothetical protein